MKPLHATPVPAILGTFCLLLLAGCGGGTGSAEPAPVAAEPPPEPESSPTPPPPVHVVRGEVFSYDTGMIANADINLWVQTEGFGYSYWWANGPLRSDALGQFEARVPSSEVSVLAFVNGFVQPCGVWSDVTRDAEVRVEMQPISAFDSTDLPLPQLSREPSVTGVVFENTANGPVPIVGAAIWAEHGFEIGIATSRTNLLGGFYLCNLAVDTWIAVYKEGFETRWIGPFDAANYPWGFEIEMVRKSP